MEKLTLEIAEKMAYFIPREERIKLFSELMQCTRSLNALAVEIGIPKTHVYRYLPKSKSNIGGLAPNNKTTAKIIMALKGYGKLSVVFECLDKASLEMEKVLRQYKRIPRYKPRI